MGEKVNDDLPECSTCTLNSWSIFFQKFRAGMLFFRCATVLRQMIPHFIMVKERIVAKKIWGHQTCFKVVPLCCWKLSPHVMPSLKFNAGVTWRTLDLFWNAVPHSFRFFNNFKPKKNLWWCWTWKLTGFYWVKFNYRTIVASWNEPYHAEKALTQSGPTLRNGPPKSA